MRIKGEWLGKQIARVGFAINLVANTFSLCVQSRLAKKNYILF